jgi:hypothetical protein
MNNFRSSFMRIGLTVITGVIVAANLMVLLRIAGVRTESKLARLGVRLFAMQGVFSGFSTNNTELSLWGLARGPLGGEAYWRELPAAEYFPFKKAEQRKRLLAYRQRREMNRGEHHEIWEQMGRKILARYNRERPGTPISAVALQFISWPSSPDGFYVLQTNALGKRQFWILTDLTGAIRREER